MKKKSLKSLSLKKSNVANISGGLQDGAANQAQNALSVGCPLTFATVTIHTIDPWRCPTMSCNSICNWCDLLD
ncbi:hypothetical protein H2O64_18440 [Kordia sp. YSTF-M3]|uniref:Bacteriocin n=1 Tax=Kordia aestuariivivens TaxID=2759037 RepID=A0ABR7QDT5_9FLAO|nr:hypothetical protein [Kordia aestuariivivens]MBC8756658.1 hypothetical protein [Kordia aestuariivivens]